MTRAWIEEGLRHTREREESLRRDQGQRQHWHALIEKRGPDLMRALVDEIGAAVEDFRNAVDQGGEIGFEALPRGGFLASRAANPRVALECRPDYPAQTVHCNLARVVDQKDAMVEVPFNLHFTVDELDSIGLRHGARGFSDVGKVAEFLLTPVLFPSQMPDVKKQGER